MESTTTHTINQTIPKGYKKTAIGFIPVDWELKSIDKTVNTISIPYKYQTKDYLKNGKYHIIDQGKNDYVGFSDSENHLIKDVPLVLFGDHTKIVKFINYPFCVGADGTKLLKSDIVENEYLYYLISQAVLKLPDLSYSRHFTELKNIQLPIPPKPEQKKIAEILSTWDEAIALTKKTIDNLKNRNKGLAQQLLTGKKRLNGFSEKWQKTNLGKITNRVTTRNEELNDTVVTISAQRGFVLQEDFFNKRVASETLSGYYLLKKGQFAYNKSYSNGYPMGAFKRLNAFEKAVVTTLYICFELKDNANSDFMVHFFENGFMTRNLMKIAKEGGRAHGLLNIGLDDFNGLELFIPGIQEQKAIAQVLETADQELKNYEAKLEQLQLQKKGLMQQLLTGKIRVNLNK